MLSEVELEVEKQHCGLTSMNQLYRFLILSQFFNCALYLHWLKAFLLLSSWQNTQELLLSSTLLSKEHSSNISAVFSFYINLSYLQYVLLGGEDLKEVVPTMDKLAKSKIGSILDLAIEADLDAANLIGIDAQKQAATMAESLKQCIDIAAHQPDSFIAVKVINYIS